MQATNLCIQKTLRGMGISRDDPLTTRWWAPMAVSGVTAGVMMIPLFVGPYTRAIVFLILEHTNLLLLSIMALAALKKAKEADAWEPREGARQRRNKVWHSYDRLKNWLGL